MLTIEVKAELVLGLAGIGQDGGDEIVLDVDRHFDIAGLAVFAVRDAHLAAETCLQIHHGIFGHEGGVVVHDGSVGLIAVDGAVYGVRAIVVVGAVAGIDLKSELADGGGILTSEHALVEHNRDVEPVGKFADRHGDMVFLRSVFRRIFQHDRSAGLAEVDTIAAKVDVLRLSSAAQGSEDLVFLIADLGLGAEFAVHPGPGVDVVNAVLVGRVGLDGETHLSKAFLLVAEVDVLQFGAGGELVVFVESQEVNVGLGVESDGICLTSRVVEFHIHSLGAVVEIIVEHGFTAGEEESQS